MLPTVRLVPLALPQQHGRQKLRTSKSSQPKIPPPVSPNVCDCFILKWFLTFSTYQFKGSTVVSVMILSPLQVLLYTYVYVCIYDYSWQNRKCINCIPFDCNTLYGYSLSGVLKYVCIGLWGLQIVNKTGQLIFVRMHHIGVISAAALNVHCINLKCVGHPLTIKSNPNCYFQIVTIHKFGRRKDMKST